MNDTSFIIKNDGTVWGSGRNKYGQLGLGNTTNKNVFTQVPDMNNAIKVVAGMDHVMILKEDGTVCASGHNGYGQLGLGDTENKNTFTQVPDMNNVKDVCCGNNHTLILKNDNTIWVCGNGSYIGLNNIENKNTFTQVSDMTDIKQIACGYNFTMVLKNDGTVWGTGANAKGQLGSGNTEIKNVFIQLENIDKVRYIACGSEHTFVLTEDDILYSTGFNNHGQLGLGDVENKNTFTQVSDMTDIKQIACGNNFTMVLKNDGTVWGTGANNYGQLCRGNTIDKSTFTQVSDVNNAKQIACGNNFTMVLKKDGTVWSCGYGSGGRLGLGSVSTVKTLTKVTSVTDINALCENMFFILFIIKSNDLYYKINTTTNTLIEITLPTTSEEFNQNSNELSVISSHIDLLPEQFSLVALRKFSAKIKGYKTNSIMYVCKSSIGTDFISNIDSIYGIYNINDNDSIKYAFSLNNGITWKTYNGADFEDLSITIPLKNYNELTADELVSWNNAKNTILSNGIDITTLNSIDFNSLNIKQIMFAGVIAITNITDSTNVENISMQYDEAPSYKVMKDDEVDIAVLNRSIKITPLIDCDSVKVNILPNGVTQNVTDIDVDSLSDEQIEKLKTRLGL